MGLRIGIVGVGSFAQSFIPLFKAHPLVERIALCDILPDRLAARAKEWQVRETYPRLEDIVRADLDAIIIMTQPWLHAPQAIVAMEHGKHVYSAVPMISLDSGDEMLDWCDKIVDACRRTGMRYMMGETSYYRAEAMFARRQAAKGAFGEFVLAEGEYFHDIDWPCCSLRDVAKARWGKDWNMNLSGGIPMHYPTHSIGGFLSATGGRLTHVSCQGYVFPNDDWFRSDTVSGCLFSNETALFRMSNGASARVCEYRRIACHGMDEQFSLYGTKGSLVHAVNGPQWSDMMSTRALTLDEMRDPLPKEVIEAFSKGTDDPYGGHGGSHAYLAHEFVTSIVEDRQPAVNAWIAARFFAPGVTAHKSAMKGGELLEVPDWGDPPK